ncbi:MAG: N-acetyltransferase, partial [Myxococcota bacterium]|nr:N-acetyltransferase [Myxococcota bacterium]
GQRAVGHVMFTATRIEGHPGIAATILAPLAVVPDAQGQGVGAALSRAGLAAAADAGAVLAFVLGHPAYYPRVGFQPAGRLGLQPPYPIDPGHDDSWMVQELRPGLLREVRGRMLPADTFMRPELWRG